MRFAEIAKSSSMRASLIWQRLWASELRNIFMSDQPTIQLKEKYQVLPNMPPEQFAALKADIAERGVLVPIDVDEDGHILDGHHRYRACLELDITDFPTIVRPNMSEEDRRIFARKNNMLRRHLNRKQVRLLVADQLRDTPSWANNRIAQVLGVDSKTVKTVRSQLEATSEIPKLDKLIGADGKERPVKQKRPPAIMASNLDELRQILERVEQGGSTDEIEGWSTTQSAIQIIDKSYDPFFHCGDAGVREWHLFMGFLVEHANHAPDGAASHTDWLLQKQFKTPSEWMGEEGDKQRKLWGMRAMKPKIVKAWDAYLAEHCDKSMDDVVAYIDKKAANLGHVPAVS